MDNLNSLPPDKENTTEHSGITPDDIKSEVEKYLPVTSCIDHSEVFEKLLGKIEEIDFRELAELTNKNVKLQKKHYLVCSIEHLIQKASENNWGICRHLSFIYLYNGAYWEIAEKESFKLFLGKAVEKMGMDKFDAKLYYVQEQLFKQFIAVAHLPKPKNNTSKVLVNFKNGTFEIDAAKRKLRQPKPEDFITYQLPFDYNPKAKAPLFETYLNTVQPDIERQNILAEYIGYVFIKTSTLKLEKTLLLFGSGANGKSVFFEIINALLGGDANVSNYSLQNLTSDNGYYRAMIANKLLNYSSEINGKLDTSIFKQLVSGEPLDARLPYGEPMIIKDFAKLIFNCNELPKECEHTNAYFRRFLIIPFDITIPAGQQDKELAVKIIRNELSGVFNWVLSGLDRLLFQKQFTVSEAVSRQLDEYKKQSDNIRFFLSEENYTVDANQSKPLKELFSEYRSFCMESGFHFCSLLTFSARLRNLGFRIERKAIGNVVYIKK